MQSMVSFLSKAKNSLNWGIKFIGAFPWSRTKKKIAPISAPRTLYIIRRNLKTNERVLDYKLKHHECDLHNHESDLFSFILSCAADKILPKTSSTSVSDHHFKKNFTFPYKFSKNTCSRIKIFKKFVIQLQNFQKIINFIRKFITFHPVTCYYYANLTNLNKKISIITSLQNY